MQLKRFLALILVFLLSVNIVPFKNTAKAEKKAKVELGNYYLQNVATGKYLTLKDNRDREDTALVLESFKEKHGSNDSYVSKYNTSKFVFKLEKNGSGVSFQPANSTTRNIAVEEKKNLQTVNLKIIENTDLQKWSFYEVADGIYSIRITGTNLALCSSSDVAKIGTYNAASKYQQWHLIKFVLKGAGTDPEGKLSYGIDVSVHQGELNWEAIKEFGIKYAIIRLGYGDDMPAQDDFKFEYNVSECKRLGIPFGVYIYSYAASVKEAKSEAAHTLRLLKGHSLAYPVYYDLEDPDTTAKCSNAQILSFAKTFEGIVSKAGYKVGFYANTYWWNNKLTDSYYDGFSRWVAQYNDECTYTAGSYDFWQYTSKGYIPGANGYLDMNVSYLNQECYYTGKPIYINEKQVVGTDLKKYVDYLAYYSNNINTGIASVKFVGIGEYQDKLNIELRYLIKSRSINKATLKSIPTQYYAGEKIIPDLNLTYNGIKLVKGRDYTVTGKNNTKPGTATLTIKGKGNFTSSRKVTFTIKKLSMKKAKISGVKDRVYTGGTRKIYPKVKSLSGVTLERDKHYKLSYKNNVNFGTATVIIKGISPYCSGTRYIEYKIIPNEPKAVDVVKRTKKTITISWSHVDYATRYQVYRATSKDGKYKRIYSTKDRWSYTYKDTGLDTGTHYYYKVRAYKKVNGVKYYSDWSDIISTSTKVSDAKFTIKAIGKKQVRFNVKAPKRSTGYCIYVCEPGKTKFKYIGAKKREITEYVLPLSKKRTYKFKIRTYLKAEDGKIYGDKSNEVAVKVK